jgi:hypothetical protein
MLQEARMRGCGWVEECGKEMYEIGRERKAGT